MNHKRIAKWQWFCATLAYHFRVALRFVQLFCTFTRIFALAFYIPIPLLFDVTPSFIFFFVRFCFHENCILNLMLHCKRSFGVKVVCLFLVKKIQRIDMKWYRNTKTMYVPTFCSIIAIKISFENIHVIFRFFLENVMESMLLVIQFNGKMEKNLMASLWNRFVVISKFAQPKKPWNGLIWDKLLNWMPA